MAVSVLGYNLYQTKKEPEGLHINVGPEWTEDAKQVRQDITPTMKTSLIKRSSITLLGGLALFVLAAPASAQQVSREKDIVGLRLGQRIKVDDGTCPAGQVKEVSGTKMTSGGVVAARKCIPRLKPKTKDVAPISDRFDAGTRSVSLVGTPVSLIPRSKTARRSVSSTTAAA